MTIVSVLPAIPPAVIFIHNGRESWDVAICCYINPGLMLLLLLPVFFDGNGGDDVVVVGILDVWLL